MKPPIDPTLSIAPRWHKNSRKVMAAELAPTENTRASITSTADDILQYIHRQEEYNSSKAPCSGFDVLASRYELQPMVDLLHNQSAALADLRRPWAYRLLDIQMRFFWEKQFIKIHNRKMRGLSFETLPSALAETLYLGWRKQAVHLGYLIFDALAQDYFYDIDSHYSYRAQAFMVRLFGQWQGLSYPFEAWAYDTPVYEDLLQVWDHPDPEVLRPLLLAAANRHTHECRHDTAKQTFDFCSTYLYHFPIEILMLYRIREWLGLKNTTLDHPLCAEPFDRLPPEQAPYTDELMEAVLARVRQDWPDYDKAISFGEVTPY